MKTNELELINVSYVGPYGPKVGEKYYRLNKTLKATQFTAGHTYSVEVWHGTTKTGEPFTCISKIVDDITSANAPVLNPSINQATPVAPAIVDNKPRRSGFGAPLTQYDLDKDLQISYSGLVQAAMGAVAGHVKNVDAIITESQRVAEAQLTWIKSQVSASH